MTKSGLSIADIEKQVVTDEAVDFEPILPNGDPSGITLLIKSDQAPSVVAGISAINDSWRRKEQLLEAKARVSRPGDVIVTNEEEGERIRRLVAVRLAGWKGLDDEFSPDSAVRLLKAVPSFISQILLKAAELGSFTKSSPQS